MSRNRKPKTVTQGDYWHRQYLLLSTTNYYPEPPRRVGMATNNKQRDLKQSCIDVKVPDQHDWTTHPMQLDRMISLIIDKCEVGRHGTRLLDCVYSIREAVARHGAYDSCRAVLYKKGGVIGFSVSGLRGKEKPIASDICHDTNLIASNGGTAEVGEDTIRCNWEVMLTKSSISAE